MGVEVPIVAWLTDRMALPPGAAAPLGRLIHPRVEPEIAFVIDGRLAGPGVTAASALAKVGWGLRGLEVIDSRYEAFRFTLADVGADNASAAAFVMGSRPQRPEELDLSLEAVLLEVDGSVIGSATGARSSVIPRRRSPTPPTSSAGRRPAPGAECQRRFAGRGRNDPARRHPQT